MLRVRGFCLVAMVAVAAAMLNGAGGLSGTALAQVPDASATQAPSAPAAAAPAAAAPAPAADATAAPAAQAPAASSPLPTVVVAEAQGGTIKGTVKASGVPLPGVAVTATNTLTGKKYATTTDVDGAYEMAVPRNGRYVVKTDLPGFAAATQEVLVNASSENGGLPLQTAEFKLELASRATPVTPVVAGGAGARAGVGTGAGTAGAGAGTATAGAVTAGALAPGAVARVGRGTQVVTVQSSDEEDLSDATAGQLNTGAEVPTLDDSMGVGAGADAVAVTGQQGQINGLATFSQDDLQNRIQDMRQNGFNNGDIAGTLSGVMQSGAFPAGPGGPGGGGPGGPGGGFGGGPGGGGGFAAGGAGGGGFGGGGGGGGGFGGGGGGGGGGRGGGGGGGGRGGFGGGGGFGSFGAQNPNAWHGSLAYTGSDNALNADSFSVTGHPVAKPEAYRNTLIASVTGTPYIPGLLKANPKQMLFLSVQKTLNRSPSQSQITVPTQAQRLGDLTPGYQAQLTAAQQALAPLYYDPNTGQPYGNTNCLPALYAVDASPTQCIPVSELNPNNVPVDPITGLPGTPGLELLSTKFYPLPNIPATENGQNYQLNVPGTSDSSQISARYNRSFGAAPARGQRGGAGRAIGGARGQNRNAPPVLRQSIAESFAYSHSANANYSFSPMLGGKSSSNGYSLSSAYTVGYGRLNNSATLSWNRSLSNALNYFTNGATDPATGLGIFVGNSSIYGNQFYYGLPSIGLTGGSLAGLSDPTPSTTVNQTISFSDSARWSHKGHNTQYGFDFHRIHADSVGGSNVLGSFSFSGYATESSGCQPSQTQICGSPVADLLLGLPEQTTLQADSNKIYLRGNSWDWYAQDDWRAKSNLTFEYGVRWEYFSPYSEKYDRLVNLNLTGFPAQPIANVCGTAAPATAPAGACAAVTTGTLVHPDKALYSPRISVAWVPKFKLAKNMVVRSGYGINYNTGAYASFARKLSFQYPFAITQTNTVNENGCTPANMSLNTKTTIMNQTSTAFNCSTGQTTLSNFGVDPNYRLGLVQVYNLGIQRTLPQGVVLNIDYTGANAFNQDMVRAPNRSLTTPTGLIQASAGQFTYEDSLGYLRSNALAVNVRERMHKGVSLQATYTYSHSIDDASSVGGSGNSIAQDDQNLGAEESNSSFDHRHSLNGNFVIEPPFGPNRAFLNKGGVWAKILDGYSISGNFTIASGGYATPQFSGTQAEIQAGAGNSLRPNRNPTQPIKGAGSLDNWFNKAAFVGACPVATLQDPNPPALPYCLPAGMYGNASRNSIELPGTVSVSGSLSRTISFGETRSLEARIQANNVFNTVQYSGVNTSVTSNTFGEVSGAAGMRSFTYTARYRF